MTDLLITELRCSLCKEIKSVTEFTPRPGRPRGYRSKCRPCEKAVSAAWYKENVEHVRQMSQRWRDANPERVRQKVKEWGEANVERKRQSKAAWLAEHPDYGTQQARAYREAHPGWGAKNSKTWYYNNLEKARTGAARRASKRRALLANAGAQIDTISDEQFDQKWAYWGGKCWMCRDEATAWDHVKPVSKGGAHCLANLRPACKPCNSRKSNKWPFLPD